MGVRHTREPWIVPEEEEARKDTDRRWVDAQVAVIGSMLLDERCVGAVMERASPELFSNATLRHIFETVRDLWLEKKAIDPVIVCGALGSDSYAETLAECMKVTPTAANVTAYVEVMRDQATLNAYRDAASRILYECGSASDAAKVWDELGRLRMKTEKARCVTLGEAISRYLDRMNDQTPPDYLSFGIKQLDNLLHVGRGKFLILAADSSAGKTALALQFAYHIAECGKKVCFFSLETDNDTLTDRLMAEAQVANINLPRSKLKALTTTDYQRAVDAGQKSARVPLYLHDSCETVDEIRTWTVQEGFDVIVVDYLQIIQAEGEKRWDVVTNISMQLHRMAQKLGVTVIGLSQVTPNGKNKDGKAAPLTMDDLRESRQLKHDADVIMILERCDDFPNGRSLTIAKNKDGKRNKGMRLSFDPEHMTFGYYKRVAPSNVAGQVELKELDDDEGGENPF